MARRRGGKRRGRAMLRRLALRRGVFGGSRAWLGLGIATWGYGKLRRAANREEQVVWRERLAPGQRVIVANHRRTVDN